LYVKPPSFYEYLNIDVQLETEVTSIDPASRTVHSVSGQSFHYDKLIIATGSRPRKIALPGSDLPGVHYLRNIDDVNAIRASLTTNSRIAIIGAGYIGLEVAAVAAQLGHAVTVVEMADRVMSRVVSKEVSHFYQEIHSAHGVALELSANIDRLTGTNRVDGVALTSGQRLPADIVIVGIGIVPNIELAEEAGLEVGNGIIVNDQCRTSDENIYAVGDCTWHPNAVLGFDLRLESVHNALEQAKTAATNICGEELAYAQVPWFWSDQFDLKLQIAGLSAGYDRTVIRGDIGASKFSCLYLSEGRLIAIDAINRPKDFIQAKALIAAGIVIDPMLLRDVQTELRDMAN
jgi:3-phenylpropionate/trans-cinnamate dioxygenase ferredoxin reductase subunit